MSATKSEGAQQHESNQPRPASDPVVEEGGGEFKPPTKAATEPVEETTSAEAGVGSGGVGQQENDGLDQDNILDNEKGIKTRGVEQDVYKEERKLDEVLGDD